MKKQKIIDGVNRLLELYQEKALGSDWTVLSGADGLSGDEFSLAGKICPILPWRSSQLIYLKAKTDKLGALISGMFSVCESCESPIEKVLFRELDLTEWFFASEIVRIVAMRNDNAVNAVISLKNGAVVTVEIATAMPKGCAPQRKYKIWGVDGFVCNQPVHTTVSGESLYLFNGDSGEPKTYTDASLVLFDYDVEELNEVAAVYGLLTGNASVENYAQSAERVKRITEKLSKDYEKGGSVAYYEAD